MCAQELNIEIILRDEKLDFEYGFDVFLNEPLSFVISGDGNDCVVEPSQEQLQEILSKTDFVEIIENERAPSQGLAAHISDKLMDLDIEDDAVGRLGRMLAAVGAFDMCFERWIGNWQSLIDYTVEALGWKRRPDAPQERRCPTNR